MKTNDKNYTIRESSVRMRLTLTDKVESKIRWWCSRLPDNEWSGVLFYDYKGSLKRKNLALTAVDFLVLDIGTSGYTEFVEDERIISYACSQGLVNQQVALIHSHNRMKAFFSGEDTNTLIKEGSARNHFLSLIVNNKGEYVAAITRKVRVETSKAKITYKTFDNVEVSDGSDKIVIDEYIEKINLDIIMPQSDEEQVYEELMDNKVTPITKGCRSVDDKPRVNDYPELFKGDSGIVDKDKVTQAYNRLATGSFGSVPHDRTLKFDSGLDEIAETDEDNIGNFIIGVTESLPLEELETLDGMLGKLDSSPYIDMCVEYVQNFIGFYE